MLVNVSFSQIVDSNSVAMALIALDYSYGINLQSLYVIHVSQMECSKKENGVREGGFKAVVLEPVYPLEEKMCPRGSNLRRLR